MIIQSLIWAVISISFILFFSYPKSKFILIFAFAAPNFLLATARLIKLTVQYLNPGQTTCMAGVDFQSLVSPEINIDDFSPLGIEFNSFKKKAPLFLTLIKRLFVWTQRQSYVLATQEITRFGLLARSLLVTKPEDTCSNCSLSCLLFQLLTHSDYYSCEKPYHTW